MYCTVHVNRTYRRADRYENECSCKIKLSFPWPYYLIPSQIIVGDRRLIKIQALRISNSVINQSAERNKEERERERESDKKWHERRAVLSRCFLTDLTQLFWIHLYYFVPRHFALYLQLTLKNAEKQWYRKYLASILIFWETRICTHTRESGCDWHAYLLWIEW